jgi:hypothetical protein
MGSRRTTALAPDDKRVFRWEGLGPSRATASGTLTYTDLSGLSHETAFTVRRDAQGRTDLVSQTITSEAPVTDDWRTRVRSRFKK